MTPDAERNLLNEGIGTWLSDPSRSSGECPLHDANGLTSRACRHTAYAPVVDDGLRSATDWRGRDRRHPRRSSRRSRELTEAGTVTVHGSAAGFAQEIVVRRHRLTGDEPLSFGGTDTGPDPYGFLLAALGSCMSIT